MTKTASNQPLSPRIIGNTPLSGRTAVVTGASSGIGAATAVRFAELGAAVALIARRGDRLDEIEDRIRAAGGTALALPTDVTDRTALESTSGRIAEELGRVDLVFANAGVQLISGITDLADDDWDRQIDLNVKGVMNTIQAFVRPLEEAASSGYSADLITTSSIAAVRVLEGLPGVFGDEGLHHAAVEAATNRIGQETYPGGNHRTWNGRHRTS